MAFKNPTNLTSWSISRYHTWKTCPASAKYKFIEKLPEPTSPAMERGSDIHKLAEDYLKGKLRILPKELRLFKDLFRDMRKLCSKITQVTHIEESWAYRDDWSQTVYNDWNGCWLRVKLDFAVFMTEGNTLNVFDWKTGKYSGFNVGNYIEQLEIYALSAMKRNPSIEKVVPKLIYLDTGDIYPPESEPLIYTKADIKPLQKKWEKNVAPMLKDQRFPPKPNNLCRWCNFSAAKGGPCKF